MPPFRIREDALEWFGELYKDNSFEIDFDAYYFCFIAGICSKQKKNVPTEKTNELVDYFPGKYRSRGNLLVGLFLMREFEDLGVTLAEKEAVHSSIGRLVSPDAQNRLSDDGVREFNRYAHAGFETLFEWFDQDKPRSLETFLGTFKKNVEIVLGNLTE